MPRGTMTTTVALAVAIRIELAAGTDREVGGLALGNVSFWSRQLRANQRSMHGPVIAFVRAFILSRLGLGYRLRRCIGRGRELDGLF